ncbi:methionine aminotransferase [candidate division KSB1 bacterium]
MENYKGSFSSKLPKVGTTIFTIMSKLALDHNAINLSQGFPDFDVSEELINLVSDYMEKGHNQYAPMQGLPKLREVISKKVRNLYGVHYDTDKEINITAGATQALYTAITSVIREDDEVIIFEPAYDSYVPAIKLNGGVPVYVELKPPKYGIDWDEVKKKISHRTRMIVLNSPHNPTGSVLSAFDIEQLQQAVHGTDILILSDEVYEHLIFDKKQHESICMYPELAARSFVVFSFGKTFHATGWKMGYCLAPEIIMNEFRKIHQFVVFTCNTPVQHAIADFLEDKNNYLTLGEFYQQKRDHFVNAIRDSRFKVVPSYGTYFQLLDYSAITEENEMDFAVRLTKEFGVAAIPVSVFYHNNSENKVLRFCFAKKEETLDKAAEVLCKI